MALTETIQGHRMGKAYSVGAKRRARKGRLKKAGPREANGRLDRAWAKSETERATTEVGLMARQRLYGLDEVQAKKWEAGTVVGRLLLSGTISRAQYDAASEYVVVRNAYQRAIGAKPDFTQPYPEDRGNGTYEDFCRNARSRHEAMQGALRDLMIEIRSPAPVSALDVFVVKDVYMPELEGDLKLALNRLVRHFFEGVRRVA